MSTGLNEAGNALPEFMTIEEAQYSGIMQSYRAAFEGFIHQKVNSEQAESHYAGDLKHRFGDASFGVYAVTAINQMMKKLDRYTGNSPEHKQRLKQVFDGMNDKLIQKEAEEYYQRLHALPGRMLFEVTCFASLKHMFGPLFEALIILDRLLFLQDHSHQLSSFSVFRLFSPDISPRSFAISATKLSSP